MNHNAAIAELNHALDQLRDAQEAIRRDIAELRAALGLPASDFVPVPPTHDPNSHRNATLTQFPPPHDPRAEYDAFRATYSRYGRIDQARGTWTSYNE